MTSARRADPKTRVVGFDADLAAGPYSNDHELAEPVEGMTFGVAFLPENAPHAGERHLAGDQVLYPVDGRARLVFTDDPEPDVDLRAGDVVIVPRGLWHRVDVLEPCHIVYLTPGRDNEVRTRFPTASPWRRPRRMRRPARTAVAPFLG